MDFRLEVVVIPVSDVDRAKAFYQGLGWRLDADFATGPDFRVVQLTPPGSACAVIFGTGVTYGGPGLGRGPAAGGRRHRRGPGRAGQPRRGCQRGVPRRRRGVPPRRDRRPGGRAGAGARRPTGRGCRSPTRTGTPGSCRRSPPGCRAGRRRRWRCTTRWPGWPTRCAGPRRRTASTRRRPGKPDPDWPALVRAVHGGRGGRQEGHRAEHERLRLRRDRGGGGLAR